MIRCCSVGTSRSDYSANAVTGLGQTRVWWSIGFIPATLDGDWNFYWSQHAYNSLYLISDIVVVHGIFKELGETDWENGQQKIMDEVTRAANDIKGFAAAFTKAIWLRKFGQEMICDQVLEVRGAPRAEEVFIPFFVQMPGEQPLSDLTTFR